MRKKYKKIEEMTGSIIMIRAEDVGLGDLAELTYYGGVTKAQVIGLDGDKVFLQVFGGTKGIRTGDELRFLGHPMEVAYSDNLLGRIFNGGGEPIDGKPMLDVGEKIIIDGPSVNPAMRIVPSEMIRTNIPMIDVFNTLVQSQKLPIFSIPGEPYNELLARVALQAEADVILIGGMGLKYDDYLFFRRKMEDSGKMGRTIMFVHTAADPVVECMLVPDLALAVAEKFGVEGKRVLVLLTDMTSFADALKEIAILMEQIPSNRGYPGDLYSQLARRYEKAVDFQGAGSITVLTVTTMPGNDVTHPVPDNTGYITEGQFYLHGGRIDPFGSLSRLKQLVIGKATRGDHNDIMNNCIRLYSGAREARNKIAMGFDPSSWDKQLLTYADEFETRLMSLEVNISLEEALDTCWEILANHFRPEQTGMKEVLVKEFWPKDKLPSKEVVNG